MTHRDSALNDLVFHWGAAYEISEGLGVWRAVRLDNGVTLVAGSPEGLRDCIRTDYDARPVPRTVNCEG